MHGEIMFSVDVGYWVFVCLYGYVSRQQNQLFLENLYFLGSISAFSASLLQLIPNKFISYVI